MTQRMNQSTAWVSVALACVVFLAVATVSQAGPPTLSTNPGRHAIFPARGQSPEQQRVDEAAAYDWASKQTGWDPYQAKAVLDQQSQGAAADHTWLCAVSSAVAVDEDGTVGPPDLGDRERPTFFRVDAAKKELTLLAPASRRGEVTKFDSVSEINGSHLFSAVEQGRGLNLIINAEGRMSLSIVGDGVVWSVFGHALREGEPDATPTVEAKDHALKDQASQSQATKESTQEEPIAADTEESAE